VHKHAGRYARCGARPAQLPSAEQRSLLAAAWMHVWKPLYVPLARALRGSESGEPRRPRGGPWPLRTPPVGPAPSQAQEVR
jgi:hypothetical protein